jgi:Rrf2 family protein
MAIGQFFSQRFGYAVHALAYMAKKPAGELTALPEVAEWMRTIWPQASDTYLSNVIQRVARGGILRSHRGIAGGYSLARPAKDISLRDLVELIEGVEINRCGLSLSSTCPADGRCSIKRKLAQLEAGYLNALAEVNIADLAKEVVVPRRKKAAAERA